jgi:hypothetical protein
MAYTYQELKGKTIQDLREIAKGVESHEAVQGYSQMNKDHLLPALCKAVAAHDHATLKIVRRHIHHLNRQIRAHVM